MHTRDIKIPLLYDSLFFIIVACLYVIYTPVLSSLVYKIMIFIRILHLQLLIITFLFSFLNYLEWLIECLQLPINVNPIIKAVLFKKVNQNLDHLFKKVMLFCYYYLKIVVVIYLSLVINLLVFFSIPHISVYVV